MRARAFDKSLTILSAAAVTVSLYSQVDAISIGDEKPLAGSQSNTIDTLILEIKANRAMCDQINTSQVDKLQKCRADQKTAAQKLIDRAQEMGLVDPDQKTRGAEWKPTDAAAPAKQ